MQSIWEIHHAVQKRLRLRVFHADPHQLQTAVVVLGLAQGRGYGVLRDATGDTVEYLGEAAAGQASGVGGMIVSRAGQAGAVYFEGGFAEGRPHGVLRVDEPGARPRLREFRAGREVGGASPREWRRLEF